MKRHALPPLRNMQQNEAHGETRDEETPETFSLFRQSSRKVEEGTGTSDGNRRHEPRQKPAGNGEPGKRLTRHATKPTCFRAPLQTQPR